MREVGYLQRLCS